MLEVQEATMDAAGANRLEQIRASISGGSSEQQVTGGQQRQVTSGQDNADPARANQTQQQNHQSGQA